MLPKGQLTIVGTIDISQFWPATKGNRSSDGDTVHMRVDPATSFLFAASPRTQPKPIKTFIGAYVNDRNKKKAVITAMREIKIRLQGIDTPELHYPVIATRDPSKRKEAATEFRQPYGASAANALHDHLKGFIGAGGTVLYATFVTRINRLHEAVDSHGRFVGDIVVGTSAAESINTWLVEQGWALPLFYDSMTAVEVRTLLNAWKAGKNKTVRPGKSLKKPLLTFDPSRNVTNAKLPDGGGLNIPKIFRRQATFWTEVPGPLPGTQFKQLLVQGLPKKPDAGYPLRYFLSHITRLDPKKRVKLATKIGANGRTNFKPEDFVFQEDPTTLFAADGTKITS